VEALFFASESRVGVIYVDGALEYYNDTGMQERQGSLLYDHFRVWGRGLSSVVSAFETKAGGVSVVSSAHSCDVVINSDTGFFDGSSAALSSRGRLAVGTLTGHIIFNVGAKNRRSISLGASASGPVRDLAFYDENTIVAGGDFSGIYEADLSSES